MNQEELAKYRVIAEQNKKLRRIAEALKKENNELRAANMALRAGIMEDSKANDAENAELFQKIHSNHALRVSRIEVFRF